MKRAKEGFYTNEVGVQFNSVQPQVTEPHVKQWVKCQEYSDGQRGFLLSVRNSKSN